jgi:hypothetical protein
MFRELTAEYALAGSRHESLACVSRGHNGPESYATDHAGSRLVIIVLAALSLTQKRLMGTQSDLLEPRAHPARRAIFVIVTECSLCNSYRQYSTRRDIFRLDAQVVS